MVTIFDALWVEISDGDVPVPWAGFGRTGGLFSGPLASSPAVRSVRRPTRRSRSETEILLSITLAMHRLAWSGSPIGHQATWLVLRKPANGTAISSQTLFYSMVFAEILNHFRFEPPSTRVGRSFDDGPSEVREQHFREHSLIPGSMWSDIGDLA